MELSFEAELWRWPGEGAWHFVTVPPELAEEIRDEVPLRNGFGSVRVTATIGPSTWDTSVFPHTETGSFVLPVKAQVRRANEIDDGDPVAVHLEVHATPRH